MNSFNWSNVVETMSIHHDMSTHREQNKVTVTRKDYQSFCKEYIFNKLKDEKFGEAFCKKFGIKDRSLSILSSETFARELIESLGYIK